MLRIAAGIKVTALTAYIDGQMPENINDRPKFDVGQASLWDGFPDADRGVRRRVRCYGAEGAGETGMST